MRIPLSAPDIDEVDIAAVVSVLRTPQLSLGPKVLEFERAFAHLTGVSHALAVSSGTAGLHLAMLALRLGPGDEVILPSFTFIAAANAIRYVGATPVFADVDARTLNLSVASVEGAITRRTRAILVVHTFGLPAPIIALSALAHAHNLFLVEDACEAIGATVDSRQIGSFSHIAVFAFYPNKQITTGEGGMVVTSDPELGGIMRTLRNQGRDPALSENWLQHALVGFNYRLSDIACALGLSQLARIEEILSARETNARRYAKLIAGNSAIVPPVLDVDGTRISWFVYVIRIAAHFSMAHRDAAVLALRDAGIGAGRYFAPIHLQPAYVEYNYVSLPVTEAEAYRTIALPFFNRLKESESQEVVETLIATLDGYT